MKKGGKNVELAAPPPPPQPVDTTNKDLLKLFAQERSKNRLDLLEFTHTKYNDWLKYFGFSMEKELEWQEAHRESHSQRKGRQLRATISMSQRFPSPTHGGAVASTTSPNQASTLPPIMMKGNDQLKSGTTSTSTTFFGTGEPCPFSSNSPIAAACWTLPPNLAAVDEFALSLGPLTHCTTVKAVVEACIQPYKQVTWRLSAYSCAHYKVRCLYRWVCHNIRVVPPQPKVAGMSVTIQDPNAASSAAAAPTGAAKKPAPPNAKKGAEVVQVVAAPTNPDDATLVARVADPAALASLFARMCEEAGVETEVAKGTLKGTLDTLGKPVNFLPWSWNIIKTNDEEGNPRQYLVDVALSSMHVTPFDASKRSQTPRGTSGVAAAAVPPPLPTSSAPVASSTTNGGLVFSDLTTGSKVFEPFYYFTDPREFAPLHYPDEVPKMLLTNLVTRTQWEIAPRTGHEFFSLGMRLDSHKKRCLFTAKSTPLYLSVLVDALATTELVCRVFRGPMAQLDPHSEPIDAKFVWQQREERDRRVTFSLMMPDVGYYTIAIGGRKNPKQCGAAPPQGAYFPTVLVYQALVNFVSVNEPMFPLQHISPAMVKIIEPFNHKVLTGPQRFAVAPMVPNIMAVGVVNRVIKPPSAAAKNAPPPAAVPVEAPRASSSQAAKKTDKKSTAASEPAATAPVAVVPNKPEIERVDLHLLTMHPERALFEGTVEVFQGTAEIWVFFGDPASVTISGASSVKKSSGEVSNTADGLGVSPVPADGPLAASSNGVAVASPTPVPPGGSSPSPVGGAGPASPKMVTAGGLKPVGQFYPAVTEIQVVKRIPAKELALNEGKSLMQPVPRADRDKMNIIHLLTDAGAPVDPPMPLDGNGKARVTGSYFEGKKL